MLLPFTPDQFLEVFATYKLAVWPAQLIAYLLGVTMAGELVVPANMRLLCLPPYRPELNPTEHL